MGDLRGPRDPYRRPAWTGPPGDQRTSGETVGGEVTGVVSGGGSWQVNGFCARAQCNCTIGREAKAHVECRKETITTITWTALREQRESQS